MAHIRIDNLPAAEGLTSEQEALIQGAGLKPFRPTLEGLETREVMSANLGSPLGVPPPVAQTATTDDSGRWSVSVATAGQYTVSVDQGSLPKGQYLTNAADAERKVNATLNSNVGHIFQLSDQQGVTTLSRQGFEHALKLAFVVRTKKTNR